MISVNRTIIKNDKSLPIALIVSAGTLLFLDVKFIFKDLRIFGSVIALITITIIIAMLSSMFKKVIIDGNNITIVYAPFLKRNRIDSCRYVHAAKYNQYSSSDAIIFSYKKIFWIDLTQAIIGDEKFNQVVDYIIQNNVNVYTLYSSQWERVVRARKTKKSNNEEKKHIAKIDSRSFKVIFVSLLLRVSPMALSTILFGAIIPNVGSIAIGEIVMIILVYLLVVFIFAILYKLKKQKA
ncbi:hypothetical protein SAMN05216351_108107 [Pseudobutyrivibrio sp. JW11]|uniref:hypothetical protein n=1 Tax=Pseudobutyrivibrio sp. JW11 TaxID=1855302 RepID=UPI0008E004A7|nr:hypothetical protein [Pseudobutyrivibrio sp. JW11]SFO39959.1 hypothetical protein SAMN05216351_108107 [Pseudobutyrivibrio sp. JW11]